MKYLKLIFLYFLVCFSAMSSSNACRTEKMDRETALRTMKLYGRVMEYLEENSVEMAFIGRKGLENKYVEYTHMGILWKDGNDWKVTDLLQPCEGKNPVLYDEGVAEFFMYSKVSTVKLLIPSGKTQSEIKEIFQNKEADMFLGEKYNLISNVWEVKYQNCTQYILEVYSYLKSGKQFTTREEAVRWYRENGYKPEKLNVSVVIRNIARMHKHVALDDRKNGKNLEISTVDANFDFIKRFEPNAVEKVFTGE
ncbi:DUF2145 domain-containing protein [Sebaldella sp. S0638]|uniref:DUF2145 domain-containing protein n=1 Tax=Sebaldella sp. S0638 TaxID=2957809 RepID=UPI00209E6731|nr:DUF2145 domain-containing protein [Sebaldella sp. S0638]MCP1223310.1 DUF2145 domain-containing protein [Sebaldella sp. S0638]